MPVAEPPSQLDGALPAVVVIGFGGLFLAIIAAGAIQLRRASRASGGSPEETETGALGKVEPGGPPS